MTDISKQYAPYFKAWPVKVVGPKPSDELLAVAHAFGRAGKQSLALAMALRDGGVTGGQVYAVCNAPQNNHRIALTKAGLFKRDNTVPKLDGVHTVYKLTLTPKGEKAMAKAVEREANANVDGAVTDKPAKAKKAKKARKAKAAETAVVEPAAVTEQVTEQGDAAQA